MHGQGLVHGGRLDSRAGLHQAKDEQAEIAYFVIYFVALCPEGCVQVRGSD